MSSRSQQKRQAEAQCARWNTRYPGMQRVHILPRDPDAADQVDDPAHLVELHTCCSAYVHQGKAVVWVQKNIRVPLAELRAVERPLPSPPMADYVGPDAVDLVQHLHRVLHLVEDQDRRGATPTPAEHADDVRAALDDAGDTAARWVPVIRLCLQAALRCGASPLELAAALDAPYRPTRIPATLAVGLRKEKAHA